MYDCGVHITLYFVSFMRYNTHSYQTHTHDVHTPFILAISYNFPLFIFFSSRTILQCPLTLQIFLYIEHIVYEGYVILYTKKQISNLRIYLTLHKIHQQQCAPYHTKILLKIKSFVDFLNV